MAEAWGPTWAGKLFTGTPDWSLSFDDAQFVLRVEGKRMGGGVLLLESSYVVPGILWANFNVLGTNGQRLVLGGIGNETGKALKRAIVTAVERIHYQQRIEQLLANFNAATAPALTWASGVTLDMDRQLRTKGWLTRDFIQRQIQSKPKGLEDFLTVTEVIKHIEGESAEIQNAIKLWKLDLQEFANSVNTRHLTRQLSTFKAFFDTVEKSPLTQEQAKAVVCFDNRVLLVASAGSGKTSTMVAKAGYALKNGYCQPERMLLLAFNADAAKELGQRIQQRLGPLGIEADKVVAKTFHAFGLEVIGQATGKSPSLAKWVESGQDLDFLVSLVDDLKDRDAVFRTHWDLFRIVLGQDLPKFGQEMTAPDAWDSAAKKEGFWTLNNEVVKSRGEQLIANWLFYNGVAYVYEAPYETETANAQYRQYHPDFYLPDANAYLEHWALNERGESPPEFAGYKEGMVWKRQLHATCGTRLLETTVADLWSGQAFVHLETELQKLGVTLDPNPDRSAPGRQAVENPRLARTFRSFMTHAKSNRLSADELRRRLNSGVAGQFRVRHQIFLALYEKLAEEWERRLGQENCIDFDDMLNMATDLLEQGRFKSPYELVMVDEFQDASQGRARLVACLVNSPDRQLFAVGDDWQSINRFAGADLGVMTDFEKRFGRATTLKLETTFRCPQSLCDVSSSFVQSNPSQLRKAVRSSQPPVEQPVRIVRVDDERQIQSAVGKCLADLAREAASQGRKFKVLVLGRYQKDRNYLPPHYDDERLDVSFITVHASKGLEADHVILPRVTSEILGFPSRMTDDPVMQLAMPGSEGFEFAEERRLFYVALTRARSTVTMVTISHKESAFITELVKTQGIEIRNIDGEVDTRELCPACSQGFMVRRNGRYGPFLGCSGFPKCKHKGKIDQREKPGFPRS